jgi:hypothetical protein
LKRTIERSTCPDCGYELAGVPEGLRTWRGACWGLLADCRDEGKRPRRLLMAWKGHATLDQQPVA